MNVCLPPKVADKFKEAFLRGDIDPAKLSKMSSEERHTFFEGFSDKGSASTINSLFESKLLLKNQQRGMVSWAKSVTGMSTEAKRDLITRIERLDKVLSETEKRSFLADLAETRLGFGVTHQEANTIAKMSKEVQTARDAMETGGDRFKYGEAKVRLSNYTNDLKIKADKVRVGDLKTDPLGTVGKIASGLAGNAKAINASLDNSAIFRQGWKTLMTNPIIWQRNARQTFVTIVKQIGGKDMIDAVNADIVSRPNYDKYIRAKLDVGNLEEAFPTTLPEKAPVLGRVYKASEAAYTGFVQKTRADVFDKYLEIAEKSGININDKKELESIGRLVNSLTGRGNLGKLEPVAGTFNNFFFSPRFVKSNMDLVLQPLGRGGAKTAFARKQAAINLVKVASGSAAVLAIAHAVKPGSVDWDPRSSDFGKIRIGNTRFDVSGGSASLATLAARLTTMSSKSASTKQVNSLKSGKYGSQNGFDVLTDFLTNKTSPVASVAVDLLKGKDHSGNKPTFGGELSGLVTPMGLKNYQELRKDPHSANDLVAVIADGLGVAANTYGQSTDTMLKSEGKEVTAFKGKVGMDKFKQAAADYDKKLNDKMQKLVADPEYKKLSTDDQKAAVTKQKARVQGEVFNKYDFKYKRAKPQKDRFKDLIK